MKAMQRVALYLVESPEKTHHPSRYYRGSHYSLLEQRFVPH